MEPKTSYNFDFLNNYFTTKEFDFINHANLESQKLDEIINKETETRDVIVNFINNLNDSINNKYFLLFCEFYRLPLEREPPNLPFVCDPPPRFGVIT